MAYKLLSNITHDGILHEAGEVIELAAETAENLIERGLVEVTDELAKVEASTETKEEVETPAAPLASLTDGPSDTSEVSQPAATEPSIKEELEKLKQPVTPNTPAPSEPTSPNLHLG